MQAEQTVLKTSIGVTILIACSGIIFGIVTGSFSIAFDGVYSLADASMSILALVVARLIASDTDPNRGKGKLRTRFSLGFWHLEPIVLGLNGILLMSVSVYALINAIISILSGGHTLKFDYAILYAGVTLMACLIMAIVVRKKNATIRSEFLTLDATAWIMSAGITAALLIAFIGGFFVEGTSLAWIAPYIDPAVLAVVSIVIIPMPIGTVRRALSDILLMTPEPLRARIDTVATAVVSEQAFLSHRAYVARIGRLMQVELYFIVPVGMPARTIEEWDRLRDEIGARIGGEGPNRWLTIAFTADTEWAE
ncbi:cation transporter [Pararhizobium sp. YC-54]|uniref:cation diffusion facilitator family transporter n=1 Tax=Pararhizobium sp. YC-54 TaxID=2986920 RepID=UPI0021F7370D|nr:cation transporter [Pararhizobium sp. YC-54]MCV9998415.1 cation transporter [Pararhizobium sp. YC-54]